jgi:hypothetical protein
MGDPFTVQVVTHAVVAQLADVVRGVLRPTLSEIVAERSATVVITVDNRTECQSRAKESHRMYNKRSLSA